MVCHYNISKQNYSNQINCKNMAETSSSSSANSSLNNWTSTTPKIWLLGFQSAEWCNESIFNVEQPSSQVFYLLFTLQQMGSQTLMLNVLLIFHLRIHFSLEVVQWYKTDRLCHVLGGNSNESETCGLGLELATCGLDDLRIRGLRLATMDLTTSLVCINVLVESQVEFQLLFSSAWLWKNDNVAYKASVEKSAFPPSSNTGMNMK